MKKLINWCKKNFFSLSALFLLAFIPLYPKIPLFDVVQTWVYIRLEDVIIAGILFFFVLFHIRKKTIPKTYLTWPIGLYWGVGLLSAVISILYIGPKLTTFTPHLTALHFLRRIEYMMLFFLAFGMIANNRKFLTPAIWTLGATVLLVSLYSAGQKFLGFPAFLTMNEEFAKGVPLRLPPTARIPSTFGGHYDLAAYMVLVIPILGSMAFGTKWIWEKVVFFCLAVLGLVTLLFTASRVSFGVYLVAIVTMLIWQKKKLFIVPVIAASILLLNSVSSASDRFYKTFRYSDVIVDLSSGKPIGTLDRLEGGKAVLEEQERPDEESLPTGSEFISVAAGGTGQADTVEIISNKPLATGSGEIATVSGSFLIQKALVYDISITTRFQGQWPKAVEAFKRNILLGSGFSTLSVASDGDYLRMLGETGIIGSIAFLGIFGVAFALFLRKKESLPAFERAFVIGVFAGIVGLLFNAILIDVFEASKVAYTLWILLGIAMAILVKDQLTFRSYLTGLIQFFARPPIFIVYIYLFVVFFHLKSLGWYFIGDDFTWLRWAAESKLTDLPGYFSDAAGFFYRPIPKLWYFLLYSVFWLKPAMYHFLSLVLLAVNSSFVYRIAIFAGAVPVISLAGALLFGVLAVHHENIYWISGHSSLLSSAFLFGSIYLFQRIWLARTKKAFWETAGAVFLLLMSMFSYDGMMVAPIIIWCIAVFGYRQRISQTSFLFIVILFYWLVRVKAGALLPSGDYGYKASTFFVNAVGNIAGYIAAMIMGPRAIEYVDTLRAILRGNLTSVTGSAIVLVIVSVGLLKKTLRLRSARASVVWIVAGFLALGSFAGLGGIAERYMFAASGFWMVAIIIVVSSVWKEHASLFYKAFTIVISIGLFIWNINEIWRLQGDWQRASEITRQSILTIKRQYFPLDNEKAFVIVNLPTREGRAWIFPTGFSDALWHMFRMNNYGYKVYGAGSIEEALQMPVGRLTHEVLVFEGNSYILRRVTKEVIQTPIKEKK